MREITIKYINVPIDEVIVEIAKYIEQGYHTTEYSSEFSCYGCNKHTVELVKYDCN